MATVIVLAPPAAGQRYRVRSSGNTVLGRDATCDVSIRKSTLSRFHAQIVVNGGRYFLEDLDSTNGTTLNGQRVQSRMVLHDGDRIGLSNTPLGFYLSDDIEVDETPTDYTNPSPQAETALTQPETPRLAVGPGPTALKERLDTFIEITRSLGSTLNAEEVLPRVLDLLFRMFPQSMLGEILFCNKSGALVPVAIKRGREGDSTDLTGDLHHEGLMRSVFDTGRSAIERHDQGRDESALEDLFESTICVPILGPGDGVLGVILLTTYDADHEFSEEDEELAGIVGIMAGQAIGYCRAHRVVVEHGETERQLTTARTIQLGMLPHSLPQVHGYAFANFYAAAQLVGGDYYFYEKLADGRLILGIADASGKGLPAAMHIVRFAGEIRLRFTTSGTLKEVMGRLSRFVDRFDDTTFITCCVCVLDPESHTIHLVNAGHPAPLCRRGASGIVEPLVAPRGGVPLGIVPGAVYHPATFRIHPGDQVVLYTDGVSEAMNKDGELYRQERLQRCLAATKAPLQHMVNSVIEDLETFRSGREPSDDVCIVAFERLI
jgi:serine phosphatase RsbU (regulator of sigma subunit)/pSer/pThr/pTyr-binding forkhead associated (FHA) protein